MGGGQSLSPSQLATQSASDQQQLQYYTLANALQQQQLSSNLTPIGIPTSQFGSMGFPGGGGMSSFDPWSAYG